MEATVYSYKMTFQTLTFRNDPRFQDGLYIMVATELAENTVNRILYGPLTEDVITRFREGYLQAALQMLEAAAILLPRANPAKMPSQDSKQNDDEPEEWEIINDLERPIGPID